jgi:hypothetical protein
MSERALGHRLPDHSPFVAPQQRRAAPRRQADCGGKSLGSAASARASWRFVPLAAVAVAALLAASVFLRPGKPASPADDPVGAIEQRLAMPSQAMAEAQPVAAWLRVDRPAVQFTLDAPDLDGLPRLYEAARHTTGGGRDDVILIGDFAADGAHLRLSAYRPGAEAVPPSSFFVDLVRRAGEAGLAVARSAVAMPLATKLGAIEVAEVSLAGEPQRRPCLAFRHLSEDPAIRLSGWFCGTTQRPAERASLACLIDHLELPAPGEETALGEWFAKAGQNRVAGCASAPTVAKAAKPAAPPDATADLPIPRSKQRRR